MKRMVLAFVCGLLACSSVPAQPEAEGLQSSDLAVRRAARAAMEGRLISEVRQLTFEGRRAGEGYYSRDGSLMVFQSERDPENPFYQIHLLDLETGDIERISPGMGKTTCSWIHPNNREVLFASTHADPQSKALQQKELDFRASGASRRYAWDYDDHFDLWMHDRKTGENQRLTMAKGYDAEGCISPDGQWIVFASNRHAHREELSDADRKRFEIDRSLFLDIYRMRVDGTDLQRLTTARGYDGGPFYSHDGKKICWRRFNEKGTQAEIMTMNADGTNPRRLTAIGAMSWAPFFHPSGDYLIFTTNRHGFTNFELYLVDARSDKGSIAPVRVTWTPKFDGLPTFTPDGSGIAWTSNRTGNGQSQVFLGGWNHTEALALLEKARTGKEDVAIAVAAQRVADATEERISAEDIATRRQRWTSGEFAKRFVGSPGATATAAELARIFSNLGLEPVAGEDFRVTEAVVAPVDGKRHELTSVMGRLAASTDEGNRRPPLIIGVSYDLDNALVRSAELAAEVERSAHGMALLLESAEWMGKRARSGKLELSRPVIFAAWAGRSKGAVGAKAWLKSQGAGRSAHRIAQAYLDLTQTAIALGELSQDEQEIMVGKAWLAGVATSSGWRAAIERRNVVAAVRGLGLSDDATMDAECLPFHQAGVPVLAIARAEAAPEAGMALIRDADLQVRLARLMTLIGSGLARDVADLAFVSPKVAAPRKERMGLKVWLGTIPDYAEAPIPGAALSGVAPGGPADDAGLRGGDVIVSMAGEVIEDINDYAAVLDDLRIGNEVVIEYVRDGKRHRTKITPRARK